MYSNPPPRPPGPPLFGPWHCVGVCALALGLGIFIAAVFPVGALMFLVAFLQILTSVEKGMNIGREKHENCRLEVTQGPLVAAAARIWRQGGSITRVHSA